METFEKRIFHFTKLNFRIRFLQAGKVPAYKASAIRGGMDLTNYCHLRIMGQCR